MKETTKVSLALAAYTQNTDKMKKEVESIVPHNKGVEPFYVERTDTEGFVVRIGSNAVIGISGTESAKDLLIDALFFPSPFVDGYVHSGFKKVFDQIKEPLNETLEKLFPEKRIGCVDIVGHSLGGAIAIGSAEMIKMMVDRTIITTYGCPNGWSGEAVLYMNMKHTIFNYVNKWDYVTKLLGFSTGRPGKDIKIKGKGGHSLLKYRDYIYKKEWLKHDQNQKY